MALFGLVVSASQELFLSWVGKELVQSGCGWGSRGLQPRPASNGIPTSVSYACSVESFCYGRVCQGTQQMVGVEWCGHLDQSGLIVSSGQECQWWGAEACSFHVGASTDLVGPFVCLARVCQGVQWVGVAWFGRQGWDGLAVGSGQGHLG